MRRSVRFFTAAALLTALLLGCSEEPPVLSRVYGRVLYCRDAQTGATSETLGVFLVASDPNGMDDLSAFYVIADDAELFWKVDSASWISSSAEGESWIGTTSLTMPGSTALPAGEYRVILQSQSGDTVEQTLSIPVRTVSAADATYPSAKVAGDAVTISDAPNGCEIWTYGANGALASVVPVAAKTKEVSLRSIAGSSPQLARGFTFRLHVDNEQAGYGVVCGPYSSGDLSGK